MASLTMRIEGVIRSSTISTTTDVYPGSSSDPLFAPSFKRQRSDSVSSLSTSIGEHKTVVTEIDKDGNILDLVDGYAEVEARYKKFLQADANNLTLTGELIISFLIDDHPQAEATFKIYNPNNFKAVLGFIAEYKPKNMGYKISDSNSFADINSPPASPTSVKKFKT